jgi:hypothetical protein
VLLVAIRRRVHRLIEMTDSAARFYTGRRDAGVQRHGGGVATSESNSMRIAANCRSAAEAKGLPRNASIFAEGRAAIYASARERAHRPYRTFGRSVCGASGSLRCPIGEDFGS